MFYEHDKSHIRCATIKTNPHVNRQGLCTTAWTPTASLARALHRQAVAPWALLQTGRFNTLLLPAHGTVRAHTLPTKGRLIVRQGKPEGCHASLYLYARSDVRTAFPPTWMWLLHVTQMYQPLPA
jgi:hypothetical protein